VRVGIYARVSTKDKDQRPETQLLPLREYVTRQGWTCAGEFVEKVSAGDLQGRKEWTTLLSLAAQRKVDVILVHRLDRAFRSVAHMVQTVQDLRRWGVGLRSYSEPMIDTTDQSPMGNLLLNILAAVAEFEKGLIAERVRAGVERARREGKRPGPAYKLNGELDALMPDIVAGTLSVRQAAKRLGVHPSTVSRAVMRNGRRDDASQTPEFPASR
jgi:DNA invertase Pin-like site-specific DNA recombinase